MPHRGALLAACLLAASAVFAGEPVDVAPLRAQLAQDYLTGKGVAEDIPEAALAALEKKSEELPPEQQAPVQQQLTQLRDLRQQALGIQKGRDPEEEPGIFRKAIAILAGRLHVAPEPPIELYGKRLRDKGPNAPGAKKEERAPAEQQLSADAVEDLLKDPHVSPARLAELQAKAADYARRLGGLRSEGGAGGVSASGGLSAPRTLTKAQLAALNAVPSGPRARIDDAAPPIGGYQRISIDASSFWTRAAADRINAAHDSPSLLGKGYHYGAALTDCGFAEIAALTRGEPETVRRAAWGATVGVTVVGAGAMVMPAAFATAGITGLGTTAAAGETAFGAKAALSAGARLGLTALNVHGTVTTFGDALQHPTATSVGMATVCLASAPLGLIEDGFAAKGLVRAGSSEASTGAESALQGAQLQEHLRQAEEYGKDGVRELENGRIRYYDSLEPAEKPGTMAGRRRVREWDPLTNEKRTWHETLDQNGRVRIVRPQDGPKKLHRMFDADGNYIGTW